jgi:hypothetical protein
MSGLILKNRTGQPLKGAVNYLAVLTIWQRQDTEPVTFR